MKNKLNLKKWILNYIYFGVIPYCLLCFYFKLPMHFRIRDILYDLLYSFVAMIVFYPFKNLYFEYKEIWKESGIAKKIFIVLGLIFVVYGVYYRAKR